MTTALAPLVRADELRTWLADGRPLVLLDCRFDLTDPGQGERQYAASHLPGAHYAHLDRDLSAPKTGANGRHPLPAREAFARTAGAWGVRPGVRVVTYDQQASPYAARAWWMLRWLGHGDVAVLDGGLAAWTRAGGPMASDLPARIQGAAPYPLADRAGMPTVDAAGVAAQLGRQLLIDARAVERFRGDVEPLDPVAGHIPGATNRPFTANLDASGCFQPAAALHAAYTALGAGSGAVVHSCGSGVTACHNLLAMEIAGLRGSQLYPGSWSEWCADPSRPVARG